MTHRGHSHFGCGVCVSNCELTPVPPQVAPANSSYVHSSSKLSFWQDGLNQALDSRPLWVSWAISQSNQLLIFFQSVLTVANSTHFGEQFHFL